MDQTQGQKTNYYDYVFKNSIKSDVTLTVKDKIIKVHKQVLGPQNPVFLEKFMSQPELTKYEILDVDSTAFQIFIDYLYTGNISDQNVNEDLLLVAHKYANATLINMCRDKLRKTINSGDVINKLLVFLECEEKFVKETCILVAKNFHEFKSRPDFKLVLENKKAMAAIVDVFDECNITVLTHEKHPNHGALIDSTKSSDLTIRVENHSFLSHKEILSTRNTVLKTVISALDSTGNKSSSITIADFDLQTFEIFLKHIYTGEVDEGGISKELLMVAHKYDDSKLKKICEDNLVLKIEESNAVEMLMLSIKVNAQKLKEEASKFIAERYEKMKGQDGFQQVKLDPEAVDAVFSQFELKIKRINESFIIQKNIDHYTGEIFVKVPSTDGSCSYSRIFYMQNAPWRISARMKSENDEYMTLGLLYEGTVPQKASATLKLLSKTGKALNDFDREFARSQNFDLYHNRWGWSNFIKWTDLKNKKYGLIENGNIKIQIEVHFSK